MKHEKEENEKPTKKWRWHHGVLIYAGVQAAGFGLGKLVQKFAANSEPRIAEQITGNESYNEFYNDLKQPVFAPPDWSFAPAWTFNNALMIWGLIRVLNMPKETAGRAEFLTSQAAFWTIFAAFSPLYFGLRSPILGAVDTVAGLALTAGGTAIAAAKLKDAKSVAAQTPTLLWLILAAVTATTVAAWNKDEFFGTQPFAEPAPELMKQNDKADAAE